MSSTDLGQQEDRYESHQQLMYRHFTWKPTVPKINRITIGILEKDQQYEDLVGQPGVRLIIKGSDIFVQNVNNFFENLASSSIHQIDLQTVPIFNLISLISVNFSCLKNLFIVDTPVFSIEPLQSMNLELLEHLKIKNGLIIDFGSLRKINAKSLLSLHLNQMTEIQCQKIKQMDIKNIYSIQISFPYKNSRFRKNELLSLKSISQNLQQIIYKDKNYIQAYFQQNHDSSKQIRALSGNQL